jgi:tetratricopeptide (TPR) repeat protein
MRAQKAAPASPEQIAALEKAFRIEPRNGNTARAIGEAYRLQSWQNTGDYQAQAIEAMKWFKRATELNRYDDSSVLRYGMCLDQIGKHDEALKYFDQANRMDPNSYFNNAYMGWHYVQVGDYAAAVVWLQRSAQLEWKNNPVAESYLQIARAQMMAAATNSGPQLRPTKNTKPLDLPPWNEN